MSLTMNMVGGGGKSRKYIIRDGVVKIGSIVSEAKKGSSSSSFTPAQPPYSIETGYISFGWTSGLSSGYGAGVVYIDQKVDFSAYTKLCYKGRFVFNTNGSFSYINCSFESWTDIGTYAHDNQIFIFPINCANNPNSNAALSTDWTGVREIDLSQYANRTDSYVGFYLCHGVGSSYGYAEITDIWLE